MDNAILIFNKIYFIGLPIAFWIAGFLYLYQMSFFVWRSCRFNYHFYIKYGKFAFVAPTRGDTDLKKKRNNVAQNIGYGDPGNLPWLTSLLVLLLSGIAGVSACLVWPISFIVGFPLIMVKTLAYKKRKKQIFEDKLKGNETNGNF